MQKKNIKLKLIKHQIITTIEYNGINLPIQNMEEMLQFELYIQLIKKHKYFLNIGQYFVRIIQQEN